MTMDQDTREGFSDVKLAIREGFASTNGRIDQLVTRGEFNAVVERLDSKDKAIEAKLDSHIGHAEDTHREDRNKSSLAHDALRRETNEEIEKIRQSNWKAVTLAATIVGILATLAQWLLP